MNFQSVVIIHTFFLYITEWKLVCEDFFLKQAEWDISLLFPDIKISIKSTWMNNMVRVMLKYCIAPAGLEYTWLMEKIVC